MSLRAAIDMLGLAGVRDADNPALATGSREEQRRKRLAFQQARWAEGIRARWPEIPCERLVFGRHWIEDTQDGDFYRPCFGDPSFASSVVGYYLDEDDSPVMLEPADPPSRAVLEERRAAREQRRVERAAAAKARYAELRKGRR